jgi:16S rRNA (guanine527-N7)-methyltransferase
MSGKEMGRIAEDALGRTGFGRAHPEAARQLTLYLQEVDFWNGKMHLVGRGRLGSTLELLVFDSLALLNAAEASGIAAGRVADIGSGAGFPGLVWKIVRPRLDLTLFDRRLKPQLFLNRVVVQLGLKGITVIAEDAANCREAGMFDLVVSKAAGRLASILPLADRLLAPGGAYLTVKGRSWEGEMPRNVQSSLRLESVVELPEERGSAVVFRKSRPV